jgi:hypothetical protein
MKRLTIFFAFSLFFVCTSFTKAKHPFFMSVTEMEYNAKEKSVEVICKIFTDDFEKTLRIANAKAKVDLYGTNKKDATMDKMVNNYISNHLKIAINGKLQNLNYIGFEIIEEAANCYFEIENIASIKNIVIENDLLYEYKKEQFGIMHATVSGKTKSTKIANPTKKASFEF